MKHGCDSGDTLSRSKSQIMKKLLIASLPRLLLCFAALCLVGLYIHRTRVGSGSVNERTELQNMVEEHAIFEMLPPKATQIEYWFMPYNQYFEGSFQTDQAEFQKWIDEILMQENLAYHEGKIAPSVSSTQRSGALKISKDILFPAYSPEPLHFIQIQEGIEIRFIKSERYREFSAAFDIHQRRAYFYFYK